MPAGKWQSQVSGLRPCTSALGLKWHLSPQGLHLCSCSDVPGLLGSLCLSRSGWKANPLIPPPPNPCPCSSTGVGGEGTGTGTPRAPLGCLCCSTESLSSGGPHPSFPAHPAPLPGSFQEPPAPYEEQFSTHSAPLRCRHHGAALRPAWIPDPPPPALS